MTWYNPHLCPSLQLETLWSLWLKQDCPLAESLDVRLALKDAVHRADETELCSSNWSVKKNPDVLAFSLRRTTTTGVKTTIPTQQCRRGRRPHS
ncbi:hypothetical protein EYF80_059918 [Liparis tanakae]|uniref:Uncharacterized protein n=1 Tax=Liparis tanakae TaxID=230148 RepID=A0A4Z2ENH3_9TELE|nr:hypothetical protein EYF80_059918 [Liparis tanakae]